LASFFEQGQILYFKYRFSGLVISSPGWRKEKEKKGKKEKREERRGRGKRKEGKGEGRKRKLLFFCRKKV